MEEEVKELGDYLDIVRRHKYWVLIPAVILIVLSGLVAYLLPATYKSEGLILIESQEIPNDLVRSTVTSYADQRIEVIKQRIMTTSKVMTLVKKYNLYPDLRKKSPVSAIVGLFRENIAVTMVEANVTDNSGRSRRATIAFKVSFMDKSPQLAQKVANDLVTEFLVENTRVRTERASETTKFLEAEANKFESKIQITENKIAEFKDEYSDSLPELLDHNLTVTGRLQTELAYNQNQIQALKDLAITLRLELVNINPYITQQMPGVGNQRPVETAAQKLLQAQAEYDRLSAKYSKNHPDIKALSNQIVDLEKQAKEEANLISGDSPPSAQFKRMRNPIYGQFSAKINASEREAVRLQSRNEIIKQKIADYDERIVRTHQVKRAYDDLTRDHENQLRKYEELRAKQLEAELAQNLESENKGESFTLIEPPLVPSKAEKPDRMKLFIMGVVASIGVGLGLALLIEMLFGGVRGYNQMSRILGSAPLVVIPMITNVQDVQERTRGRLKIVVAAIVLLGLCVAGFHYWVMDLEVFWFKLLRKISLF